MVGGEIRKGAGKSRTRADYACIRDLPRPALLSSLSLKQ